VGVRLLHLDEQVGVIIVIIIAIVMQMSVESIVAAVDFFPLAAHFCLVPWLRLGGQAFRPFQGAGSVSRVDEQRSGPQI
jgi:hypothetical protein